jgi:hypothetical protein
LILGHTYDKYLVFGIKSGMTHFIEHNALVRDIP